MFITVKDCRSENKRFINTNYIVQITQAKEWYVIELDDCDGTFVCIDRDTYTSIKRTLERMG